MDPADDHVNEQQALYLARAGDAERKAGTSEDDHMRDTWHRIADSWRAQAAITIKHY